MGWRRRWEATRRVVNVIAYGVVLPLVAVGAIVIIGLGMPDAIDAARGEGQAGTFVAERRDCSPMRYGGESCSWYGTFRSADGSTEIADVLLDTDTPRRVGDRLPVLYEGATDVPKVYLAEDSKDWLWGLFVILMAAGYLGWCGWWLLRHARTAVSPT